MKDKEFDKIYDLFCNYYEDDGSNEEKMKIELINAIIEIAKTQNKELIEKKNKELVDFAKFIGNRPLPEYSKSIDKWRWLNNNKREYQFANTDELLREWGKTNKK